MPRETELMKQRYGQPHNSKQSALLSAKSGHLKPSHAVEDVFINLHAASVPPYELSSHGNLATLDLDEQYNSSHRPRGPAMTSPPSPPPLPKSGHQS